MAAEGRGGESERAERGRPFWRKRRRRRKRCQPRERSAISERNWTKLFMAMAEMKTKKI